MLKSKNVLFICLFSFLLLTACTANEGEKSSASDEEVEETPNEEKMEDEKGNGEPIKLYGNDFIEEITPKFQEDTGYEIEGVHYGGGEALAQIEAEQGNPQWDIIMMDGHGSIRNLADRGFVLTDWEPENIDLLNDEGKALVPEDNAYTPIGLHASAVIAYNTDILTEETAPKTWDEFFAYDGPVGHADPAVAAPAYPLVSSFFHQWGVEEGKERYTKRFEDGFYIYPKNGPVTSALINGEIHIAALQEHNAYQAELDGEPVGVIWPDEGAPGSLRVVAINKDSKNLEAAKAFVEYMLEPDTQNFLTSMESENSSLFTPLSEGAKMREERRQDGTFLLPPAEWAAEHEAEIKTWFADQNVN
ncbi:extracellular solute-binding protein [Pseudogracilibacillus auburnensis]|uniref:extracellular solute-binding protein n=1 Tax=Pseudogracilibacillus auburnensis TaxID=1494959 RepID=UPI001A9643A0|nr:extracellular solute-binding protein [Pseudogracilibacillus auburnensis]MBO1001776.1 extracellular solute-binding protein [Pseudogracilibacillus auburnensis]